MEMQYAIDAGLDYFAFVWYPTEGSYTHKQVSFKDCSHKVYELNYARELYMRSSLRDKLGMCAILAPHHFTDGDLDKLTDAFGEEYYEKIDGRPLLYVYQGYIHEVIEKIIKMCEGKGIARPYVAVMGINTAKMEPMPLADALSAYTIGAGGISDHSGVIEYAINENRKRLVSEYKLIPTFTVGWNPTPRIERPTPWVTNENGGTIYADVQYAERATSEEIVSGAERFADFLDTEGEGHLVGHILTFAWNEFEEGGFFCPTYAKDGSIDDSRVRAFAAAAEIFRKRLSK